MVVIMALAIASSAQQIVGSNVLEMKLLRTGHEDTSAGVMLVGREGRGDALTQAVVR